MGVQSYHREGLILWEESGSNCCVPQVGQDNHFWVIPEGQSKGSFIPPVPSPVEAHPKGRGAQSSQHLVLWRETGSDITMSYDIMMLH